MNDELLKEAIEDVKKICNKRFYYHLNNIKKSGYDTFHGNKLLTKNDLIAFLVHFLHQQELIEMSISKDVKREVLQEKKAQEIVDDWIMTGGDLEGKRIMTNEVKQAFRTLNVKL